MKTNEFFLAAVLEETNIPITLKRIKIPNLKKGQVLVKVRYSGICRSQLMEIRGLRGHDKYLPHLLGHEGFGKVLKIGEGVTKVKPGDEVIISWIKSNGIAAINPTYLDENNFQISAGPATTLSEMTVVSENRVSIKPNYLPDNFAALFGCALLTGMGMALKEVKITQTNTVMIYGLGGIGMGALLGAISRKPRRIIVVDKFSQKRLLANKLGVKNVLSPSESTFLSKLYSLNDGEGVDVCLEAAGSTESIESAFDCLNTNGSLIFASHPDSTKAIRIFPHDLISGKRIQGTWGGSAEPDTDIEHFSKVLLEQNLPWEEFGIKEYRLEDINLAISDFEQGKVLRPLINFT